MFGAGRRGEHLPSRQRDEAKGAAERRAKLEAELEALPADFDPELYLALYPDLAGLRGTELGAEEHYLRYGRREGRRYKSGIPQLETEFGQLPADFDVGRYIDLHPDLEGFKDNPEAAVEHYLREGRAEGRGYKRLSPLVMKRRPADLEKKKKGVVEEVPDRRVWTNRLNVADFRALNPDLAKNIRTRDDAIRVFETAGVERLSPLALDETFDPDFYRARHPETASLDAAAAYRHWLDEGLLRYLPGSEAEFVRNLIWQNRFPDSFDWQDYVRGLPSAGLTSRWAALEHLVDNGVDDPALVPVSGAGASSFLEALATRQWDHPRRKLAVRLLERAVAMNPERGGHAWKLAVWKLHLGDRPAAEALFRQAVANGYRSVYAVVQLVELCTARGDFAGGYDLLRQSRAEFQGYGPWIEIFGQTLQQDFATAAEAALALHRTRDREAADALLTETLRRITAMLGELDDLPAPLPFRPEGHVVLFANHGLAQCRHYRVEQRCRQLTAIDVPFRVFDSDAAAKARQALVGARSLIVYREPAYPETIRLILHARAMGVPVFYEIDDLIFDSAHYPDGFDTYEKQIPFEDYIGLLYGVPLFRFAATLCDRGIASTAALARHLAPLTREGACEVVPNGLDDRNDRFLDAPLAVRRKQDEVFIFYGSGAKAHNRNFNETVGPALLDLLASRPTVKLVVIGHLDLDPALAPFADRVLRYDFSKDLAAYWALLSEADINLAVLVPGTMNDGKSEIKWLEAAVSGVPSVVSATATYREVVRDGIDGFLADSPDAWRSALFRLVDDPGLRHRVGGEARKRAAADYGLSATAARLGTILAAAADRAVAHMPARTRARVMIVHVLFPPQTFGGATRVVRDNVDDLLARYGGDYELAVFTTDFDAAEETSRIGSYGGVPVFRYGRNSDKEFDYREPLAADYFAEVLQAWQPDLVHFHCIQFLTGSIVERCRQAKIPYLVTLHDAWWISPNQFLIDKDYFARLPHARALEEQPTGPDALSIVDRKRYLADRLHEAAVVTAVSESFADIYRRCGFAKTRAVPNGLSAQFLSRREDAVRRRRNDAARDRVRIGHIGGRSHHKGFHLLQIALQRNAFDNLEAVVIDHTQEQSFQVEDRWGTTPVTIRGSVPQENVIALYESLDVLIAPSTWPESFGLVSREALALGLWVVVSNLGALSEGVVEGRNGFVIDTGDAQDLARVLRLIDGEPGRFTRPPDIAFDPRPAAAQTDDVVAIYREIVAGDCARDQ